MNRARSSLLSSHIFLLGCALGFALTANAHVGAHDEDCVAITDRDARLTCYDLQHDRLPALPGIGEDMVEEIGEAPASDLDAIVLEEASTTRVENNGWLSSLSTNNPNFFGIATPNPGDELGDETHFELRLSLDYRLWEWDNTSLWKPDALTFVYNAKYDFYYEFTERYQSAPVLSRQQNPGIALDWRLGSGSEIRFGWFHESNGQTIDTLEQFVAAATEPGGNGEPLGFESALSQVSRGWDYAQIRWRNYGNDELLGYDDRWRYQVEYRAFCNCQGFGFDDKEDNVFWRPIDEQPDIDDYDGLRASFERMLSSGDLGVSARLDLKTGTSGSEALSNISGRISLALNLNQLRLSAFYFDGYGKEPSTYHIRSRYAGLGLQFN